MRLYLLLFILLCVANSAHSEPNIDFVLVKKSDYKMFLLSGKEIVREYNVRFGANPRGHKQQQGDEKTPEGTYELDYKNPNSSFYKAIHISYPNPEDIERARENNVDPGGQIMIHGQKNGYGWLWFITQRFNWTDGCIAVTNREMEEIYGLIETGTPIEIQK